MKTAYDVILTPVITEKSMDVTEAGKYTFKVATDANKTEIKDAVEEIFGVKVKSVNIANYDGKVKRQRYKTGRTPAFKKAVVTIDTEGKEISFLAKGGKVEKSKKKIKTSIEEFGFGQ
ncbi:MAG: 50S ribosomal protein L23 [Clostridiales bacterium]|nr:50S ribosomal protein L23 [Clostridiales bacterium]MBO4580068.1 50S ribosomal protein L23 [Clostridiales bacterium]